MRIESPTAFLDFGDISAFEKCFRIYVIFFNRVSKN